MRAAMPWALLLVLSLLGCKSSDPPLRDAGPKIDSTVCQRPPLSLCEMPPFGTACPDRIMCPGCNCAGTAPAPACHPITQDCRYFCTGCYPKEYVLCDADTAQNNPNLAGRCGYCFLNDAGPAKCNNMGDAGAVLRDAETIPRDAGAPEASR